jgi:hypothetical protein
MLIDRNLIARIMSQEFKIDFFDAIKIVSQMADNDICREYQMELIHKGLFIKQNI